MAKLYFFVEIPIPAKLPSDIDNIIKTKQYTYLNGKSYIWRRTWSNIVLLFPVKKKVDHTKVKPEEIIEKDLSDILNVLAALYRNKVEYGYAFYEDVKSIINQPINRSVKAKSAKNKGKRLETYVAEKFEKALNLPKGSVHRAQSSGTFIYDIGDIRFNVDLPIVVECKNNESWNYKLLLTKNINEVHIFKKWIDQAKDETIKAQKLYPNKFNIPIWFLIFSKNTEPIYILTDKETIDNLLQKKSSLYLTSLPEVVLINNNYYIFELETFLNNLQRV